MKQLEADVVVIAAGTAGLSAAVAAAEAGVKVIVLEKRGTIGGSANFANMVFAVESHIQKEKKVDFTKEEAFRLHMDYNHWRVDARLVKAFYDKSANTIEWLEKQGVEFAAVIPRPSWARPTAHVIKPPPEGRFKDRRMGTASTMMKILNERAKELGVEVMLKTPAIYISKNGSKVTGVIAQKSTGEEIKINSKAVIIATGGFSCNREWVKKYAGLSEGKDFFCIRVLGLEGDGIRMAWEAGAAATQMHMGLIFHMPPPYIGAGGTAPDFAVFSKPNLLVNIDGERFVTEDIIVDTEFMGNAIAMQKKRTAFMIFDGDTKKYYQENEPKDPLMNRYSIFESNNLDENIKSVHEKGYKYIFAENSLEDLCVKTGINLKKLKNTIEQYNKDCQTGNDSLLGKDPKFLRSVKNPKFYAAQFFPGSYGSVGGIKINYKTEVLDKNQDIIPGLYAAGSDANSIHADTYVPLGGNYMGFAVNTGRIAAENAVAYVKSIK